jgi:hypothetical protein
MEKIKSGYKVFCGKHTLKPATSSALQSIRYKIIAWTEQKKEDHGAFAVFKELEQAQNFNRKFGTQIRRVDYIESYEDSLWKKKPPVFCRNRYGKGYHAESAGISEMHISLCPEGTVLAEAVFVYPEILE